MNTTADAQRRSKRSDLQRSKATKGHDSMSINALAAGGLTQASRRAANSGLQR